MPVVIPDVNTALPSTLPSISWWQIAAWIWLAGAIAFLVYHMIKHCIFTKMAKRWSENITDEQTLTLFQSLKKEMGISKRINLYLCSCVGSPMMIGFVSPRILLPKANLAHDELCFILKHELVHYKRKDLLYKYLVLIATAIHWFNPIVYLMAKSIDLLCETSCDAEVIRSTDTDIRQHYSETIIGVVKYHSKLKTALSTNFYGGKKVMKKRILSIMDTSKKKAGFAIVCGVLIITMGTGFAFAANATANMPQANGNTTFIEDSQLYDKSVMYEQYKDYSMTYDKAADNLYFNGKLVRYFEDYYPVSDYGYAGIDYFNENGTIDVHGVRDLSQLIHNADGSYDPSGKLIGVEPYSQAEFDARDIEQLKNPPQANTVYAANDASNTISQTPQHSSDGQTNNATTYATVDENVSNNQGETFDEKFLKYKDYGITFDANSKNGGIGNVYYQGQLVKSFADITPNGGVFSFSSSDGGDITVRTVYDASRKLNGVEVVSNITPPMESANTAAVNSSDNLGNLYEQAYAENEQRNAEMEESFRVSNAKLFSVYEQYGLTYNKETNRLYYNGELVRYFRDNHNTDGTFSGTTFPNVDGNIDVHAVRDSAGKLTGVEPYSQTDFDVRTKAIQNGNNNVSESRAGNPSTDVSANP